MDPRVAGEVRRGDAQGRPEAPAAAQREPQEHRQRRKGTIKL